MSTQVTINPYVQTSGNNGLFNVKSTGVRQGTAYPDPATRYRLRGGYLATDETLPMWGGVGIYADVPGAAGTPNSALGPKVGRANALTGSKALAGFSVFDQAYGMVTSPQSPVPLIGTSGQVIWYPLGSLARIAVACDPSLIDLQGGPIKPQVSWDFTSQLLVPFSGAYGNVTITGAVWANTAGGQTTFTVGTDETSNINAGDDIDVANVVSTGGTGVGFNGRFTVVSIDSTHIVVSQPEASSPGTYSSGGIVVGGGGALPVAVLDVMDSNCEVVVYDPVTGFGTWDYDGAAAVIQI